VTILGGGGIAASLLKLLAPLRTQVTVVRRQPASCRARRAPADQQPARGAGQRRSSCRARAHPATEHIIGPAELAVMRPDAWLINVARGRHVDTDALVEALRAGSIGGPGWT